MNRGRWVSLAAVLLTAMVVTPAAAQRAPITSFAISYVTNVRGIDAGEVDYAFTFRDRRYQATSTRRLTGLARTLMGARQDFSYAVRGRLGEDGRLYPEAYQHQDSGGRHRIVRVSFSDGEITTTAEPPMGMGRPPATAAQKAGSIDQVSMVGQMLLATGDPCRQSYRVLLDGRSRFDLTLTPAGQQRINVAGFHGAAVRCAVEFRPIAGFPHPQTAEHLTFLFAPVRGYWAPLSIEMPTDEVGIVRLQAARFTVA